MKQLTFGEQLKIILSRRGMTIKGLAEQIEKETGKKMSRQNLTQRLGRDNFQEQDMRMIADILECSFTLNILTAEETGMVVGKEVLTSKEDKKELSSQVINLLEDDLEDILDEISEDNAEDISEDISKEVFVQDDFEDIPEEYDDFEEDIIILEKAPSQVREEAQLNQESHNEKLEEVEEAEHHVTVGDLRDMSRELTDLEREANFRAKGVFLRVKGVDVKHGQSRFEEEGASTSRDQERSVVHEEPAKVEQEPVQQEVPQVGEINPYTGVEYESNSVRTQPSRIGYVQVYDRGIHRWKDMTEWAFLGYQERKKAILGSRYEEPIYLD
jgi:hypothetical protein